jgi:hypothetical protein
MSRMGLRWILCALAFVACVDGGDSGDAATQGSLGGPCFANNTCNANLTCVLVNGKGICEQGDATTDQTTTDAGSDVVTQDQTTQDVTGDVAPVDAGCEATVLAQPACFGCAGQNCCPTSAQCYQSGCGVNCNFPCWSCTRGSECGGGGLFCCDPNATVQPTCPPTATIDLNPTTGCSSTCTNGLFLCQTNGDCPQTAPTCVGANVSGLAHTSIGVCM